MLPNPPKCNMIQKQTQIQKFNNQIQNALQPRQDNIVCIFGFFLAHGLMDPGLQSQALGWTGTQTNAVDRRRVGRMGRTDGSDHRISLPGITVSLRVGLLEFGVT